MMSNDYLAEDWPRIKIILIGLTEALRHLQERRVVHCDLKPKNVMRFGDTTRIIDLDCSCKIGSPFDDSKHSSGFLPPEVIVKTQDADGNDIYRIVRDSDWARESRESRETIRHAYPSRDMWALGVILFYLCTGLSLIPTDVNGNIENHDFEILHEFTAATKERRLAKIKNMEARNLVAQLLSKDPSRRPLTSQVLSHPFLTNRVAPRMVGQEAEFDVFISYRLKSDIDISERFYESLTAAGLKVWWDKKSLLPGQPWNDGFCDGFVKSRVFLPILSREAINDPSDARCSFASLTETSPCDNVLLEHSLALEFRTRGLIEAIFPLFLGDRKDVDVVRNYFLTGCHPISPSIVIKSVVNEAEKHLDRLCLGSTLVEDLTVRSVLDQICLHQGHVVVGSLSAAIDEVTALIITILKNRKSGDA
jgi:serine/threonine protein kinase